MSYDPAKFDSNAPMWDRLRAIESTLQNISLTDLPLTDIGNWMNNVWQPEANQLLLPESVGPQVIGSVPGVKVYRTTNQSIPNATNTKISWQTDKLNGSIWNTGGGAVLNSKIWDASDPTKLKCWLTGAYLITLTTSWAANANGQRQSQNLLNNTNSEGVTTTQAVPNATTTDYTTCMLGNLQVGDFIEVQVFQNSGGALDFTTGSTLAMMWMGHGRFG